ncbi:hypothetical protein TPL01_02610 [Sulfuriferula plumbiphila]|uniref:Glycosyl hydrolase n=1 Tax=Sulfuriferula plumbiphila TaxID=171865 RepID=A0A512L3S1_9PROT|nr:hypothetical protein [Sulfuriferula plumbiphila]BBP02829.1 hypothetical protein SFPGR_02510 [Sulfuriferula plumbiphila]GEP29123.1 hypothetical protein TPL01_02610 [Sulfuriferula plumbiphila]
MWALLWLLPLAWALVLAGYAKRLIALWREPAWRCPVLVIESDDWGAGVLPQAAALDALRALLGRHRDHTGRCPVMALGIVLAIADTGAIRAAAGREYLYIALDDARLTPVLAALRAGITEGVFAPQLHGMEHYWPAAVMAAAQTDKRVAAWLAGDALPRTEDLPAPLQSRWTAAAVLPSLPLSIPEINAAAADETAAFQRIFGITAQVAVPPTFVWSDAVERAWAAHGVRCIVTPGTRHEYRDAQGRPAGDGRNILNGERGQDDVLYVVRDQYFEPALGHRAEQGLAALAQQTACARPTLLETHRFNFLGESADAALHEVDRLLGKACAAYPALRFLPTQEIAAAMARRDAELIETGLHPRLRAWLARIHTVPRFAKLARLTGLALPLWLLTKWTA